MTPPPGRVRLLRGDARRLDGLDDASVHLVVTSPPYPMIPQWDEMFRRQGIADFPAMQGFLREAWKEAYRVLVPGGLLVVVIGDALRTVDGEFQLWPNHADTLVAAREVGFRPLPYALWKKPTNKPNAFLGSGFEPPNAYVTLDCEYVLVFRKGALRRFPPHDPRRAASRFSRAERDRWFSQVWDDIRGTRQEAGSRRTGAFPDALADRLVRMFSVVGDTVLDPFAGTGTTLWAASALGRDAVGVEWDEEIYAALRDEAAARGLLTASGRSAGSQASSATGRPPPSQQPSGRAARGGRTPPRPRA